MSQTLTYLVDCKTLAPVWEKVAADFAAEPSVLIAKIDAEAENAKATAKEQEVSGYPTIKFFPKGSTTPETYQSGRDEVSIVDFVNSKAGTFRVAGGGLNSKAGTIEAIDTIIAKYISSGAIKDADAVTKEITKAIGDLKDKSVEYYLRTLSKITGNPEYAMKEQTRLAGLLKKGGLAPEKIDEMTKRSNILAKFLAPGNEKSEL
jgi:protein disulfide-isomerase A6